MVPDKSMQRYPLPPVAGPVFLTLIHGQILVESLLYTRHCVGQDGRNRQPGRGWSKGCWRLEEESPTLANRGALRS